MSERPLTQDFETTAHSHSNTRMVGQSIAFGGRLKLCVFRQAVNREVEICKAELSGMDDELYEVAPKINLFLPNEFVMGPFKAKNDI